jgi:hypothetical protein
MHHDQPGAVRSRGRSLSQRRKDAKKKQRDAKKNHESNTVLIPSLLARNLSALCPREIPRRRPFATLRAGFLGMTR